MQPIVKIEGATNTPIINTIDNKQHNIAFEGLQALREIAWRKALKYRFDPVLSQTHEEYLIVLNNLLEDCVV